MNHIVTAMTYRVLHITSTNNHLRIFVNSKDEIYIEINADDDKPDQPRGISISFEDACKLRAEMDAMIAEVKSRKGLNKSWYIIDSLGGHL